MGWARWVAHSNRRTDDLYEELQDELEPTAVAIHHHWSAKAGDGFGVHVRHVVPWASDTGNLVASASFDSAETQGIVTASLVSPIVINNVYDLQNIQSDLSGYYVLGADINASGFDYTPIGGIFSGTLDGQGHFITGLNDGLFSSIGEAGLVTNLQLVDVSISVAGGASLPAGIAGGNQGTINNVSVSGSIDAPFPYVVGGIVVHNSGTITNASVSGSVIGTTVGGIAGGNGFALVNGLPVIGVIEDSYSSAAVGSSAANSSPQSFLTLQAGGLVAYNYGIISNAYATGTVTGAGYYTSGGLESAYVVATVGGLVGLNTGSIADSFATGDVIGTIAKAGGFVGTNSVSALSSGWLPSGTISGSYAGGTVTANGGYSQAGGFVAHNQGASILQSYSTGSVSGVAVGSSLDIFGNVVGNAATINRVGGFAGVIQGGTISETYSSGHVSGSASGTGAIFVNSIGGFVGVISGTPTATSSYWDMEASGIAVAAGSGVLPGVSALTTSQFQSGGLPSGFDPSVWTATVGGYPTLLWQTADSNDAPIATDIAADAQEDTGNPITMFADYADADASDTHTFSVDTSATLGAVINNGDGSFSYDPNGQFEFLAAGETATDSFNYTVDDGNGGQSTATATITVHGENDAPSAAADAKATQRGTTVQFDADHGVLANDTDPDANDVLRISAVNGSNANVGIAVAGDYGTLTLNPDGSYSYYARRAGTDTFDYEVNDGRGGVDTASLIFTTQNSGASIVSMYALDADKVEGNSGETPYTFVVARRGDLTGSTTVDWSVGVNADPAADATDFVGGIFPTGTIVFEPGERIKTITVQVQGDLVPEIAPPLAENFVVQLLNPSDGAVLGVASAAGHITDDDYVYATYTSGPADPASGYNITLNFLGEGWRETLVQIVKDQADYLTGIITGDLENFTDESGKTYDDVTINLRFESIDGFSLLKSTLASGGPDILRPSDSTDAFLPAVAHIWFDIADVGFLRGIGVFGEVALHEMMHAIGFGTLWSIPELNLIEGAGTASPSFKGASAVGAYMEMDEFAFAVRGTQIPISADNGHWSELVFDSELGAVYKMIDA